MKSLKYIIPSILILSAFACDKIDNPYPDVLDDGRDVVIDPSIGITITDLDNIVWDTVKGKSTNKRNVIIEEFTGQKCKFCPIGSKVLHELDSIYGDQVIPVSIHAGSFARPQAPPYTADFRVLPEADLLLTQFNPNFLFPRGIVSRLTTLSTPQDQWRAKVDEVKNDAPKAKINLTMLYSTEYDTIIRLIIDYSYLTPSVEEYNLQAYIIENHIISPQLDGNDDVLNYDHKYMLRKFMNGEWGTSAKEVVVGEDYHKEYVIPKETKWNADNLKAVVFLAERNSKEIIQAAQTSVK